MSLSLTTGPEGTATSAVVFNGSAYLRQDNDKKLTGDFTILAWIKDPNFAVNPLVSVLFMDNVLSETASLHISLETNDNHLYFNKGGSDSVTLDTSSIDFSSWKLIYAIRSGVTTTLGCMDDSTSVITQSETEIVPIPYGGNGLWIGNQGDGVAASRLKISGLKIIPRAYTEADILYHMADTLNNEGRISWP